MRRCVWLLFGCVGCDLVLGVNHYDPPRPETPQVTGHLIEHVVTYGGDFVPVAGVRPYPASDVTLSVILDDGSTPDVTYDSDGSFTFVRPAAGQAYRLRIVTPDVGMIDYQLTTDAPLIGLRSVSRIDSEPVTMPTHLNFDYTGVPPGFTVVTSTGIGSGTNPGNNSGIFSIDWKTATPLTGAMGLLNAAKNDRLYYVQFSTFGAVSTAYNAVSASASLPVTIVDGTDQTLSGTLTPATSDQCAHVVAPRNTLAIREADGAPRSYMPGADWSLFATASLDFGPIGLMLVALANEGSPATDVDVMPAFYNPFPGTAIVAELDAGGNYDVRLGTALPVLNTDVTRVFIPLDLTGSCFNNVANLKSDIAIPRTMTLDGTPLDTDDKPLVLASSDHVITWTSSSGPVDYTNVLLVEITAPGNLTTITHLYNITTTLGSATFPAALFASGHTYAIAVENRTGYDAKTGDLDTIHWPAQQSRTTSFTFHVQ